jgi:hypothetical protein
VEGRYAEILHEGIIAAYRPLERSLLILSHREPLKIEIHDEWGRQVFTVDVNVMVLYIYCLLYCKQCYEPQNL